MAKLIYLSADEAILEGFIKVLDPAYALEVLTLPEEVQMRLKSGGFDAVLLDDAAAGYLGELNCRAVVSEAKERSLPVLMLNRQATPEARLSALELGCDDYLAAPFLAPVVEAKLRSHFKLSELQQRYDEQSDAMAHVMTELSVVQDAAILCLASVARVRDHSTGNHILRTQHYVKALAEHLRHHPRFSEELDSDTIELLYKTAALHDIGKVAIPDAILQKPGPLTPEEFEVMKQHAWFGYQAMHTAEQLMERSLGERAARFLKVGQQVTLSHHERWDGAGYPQGLKGEQIPVAARLMSVADVYDAISSRRPYKDALGHDSAVEVISAGRGTHFDPDVVDAFIDLKDTFARISLVLEDLFPSLTDLSLHSIEDLVSPQEAGGERQPYKEN
ncbi:HD-GYP domain-containing protein [Marinobacterium lutimaris]|uniref:Putative two-component system response regulator n=1 Tax=Marinobacterium lutimaris TaxID=568106 RepID=A0A1H5XJ60_9GAMM|nr:HD domain-containing phosphohydrolase [Marinobacterium lutimaris]SEG11417.1 putative two-component system response regulator [Marinobacterium lutimaris]